ncbi:stemmadenine O-acetyltransferase-like [Tripterygium wilfordii]|uniref:stemmadenine O-acetyltransferase-like n=1 Tax=Tripterygium wilfordii TaxID=458696 RepID=UPI0018F7F0F1|nr:stemmadenine O-acetyltransferase-like [Tripterygium wilfordii]
MEMQVHRISKETIKPSSPTPCHLHSFKISILDQLFTSFYFPLLFFYTSSPHLSTDQKLTILKDSLSKTLTRFYPLAGRIKDSINIDCNDEGVSLVETRVNCAMCDCLKPPETESLSKLLPCQFTCPEPVEKAVQVAIQANIFDCGGIALGICFLHKLIDGTTFSAFIKSWAEIARGDGDKEVCVDSMVASSLFPPNEAVSTHMPFITQVVPTKEEGESSIKRFVFDEMSISCLKNKARSESVPNPTRVEVVSGLLWKCLTSASAMKLGSQTSSVLVHIVNLRPRSNPPLPDYSIGNIIWRSIAYYDQVTMQDKNLPCLVDLLRKSKEVIDSDYLQNLQGEEGYKQISNLLDDEGEIYSKSGIVYVFSSLVNMGFYEVDFGWGRPMWVTVGPIMQGELKNVVYQMESRSGGGMEIWVILNKRAMAILEHDPEIIQYATLNPDI